VNRVTLSSRLSRSAAQGVIDQYFRRLYLGFGFSPTLLAGSGLGGRDLGGNRHFDGRAAERYSCSSRFVPRKAAGSSECFFSSL
ncbi:MAG: hypothetical protein ACREQZ_08435, partial [Woeseiaceae bacterium]